MEWLTEFCDFIISVSTGAWEFLCGIMENTMMLTEMLTKVAGLCFDTILSFPVWLQAFGVATITISLLFMILGREGGKN